MVTRLYTSVIVVFWLVAMGWLFSAKVMPLLARGDAPDDRQLLPPAGDPPRIEFWQIRFDDRPVGWALTKAERQIDGAAQLRSHVQLERLPIDKILSRVLGLLRAFLPQDSDERLGDIDMIVRNRVDVDPDGSLGGFETSVNVARIPNFVKIRGKVRAGKLHLAAGTRTGAEENGQPEVTAIEQIFELDQNQLCVDALAPRARMEQLKVGQTWTFRSFLAFPPNAPAQVVQARVDRQELLLFDSQPLIVFVVEFRDEGGSGLSAAREPIARLWVSEEGEVLQTEASLIGLKFRFIKQPTSSCQDKLPLVNAVNFP